MPIEKERKLKIVYCTPALYSAGGIERMVSVKASYFADHLGYDVTIVVTEGEGEPPFFHISDKVKIVNLGIGFEQLWRASFIKKVLLYLQKQRQYKKKLSSVLLQIRPDITISVLRREINFINSIPDGSKKIGELHVNRANYRSFSSRGSNFLKRVFSNFWMKSLIRHLRQLDQMVVLTENALNDWPELSNVTMIPDPLPFQTNEVSSQTSKRVVSIGRYDYDKGNDLLLQAWAIVEKQCPDWRLDIYGNGNREYYQSLLTNLHIDSARCQLHGTISDVCKVYTDSSLFVLPSRFEGFGLVLIEALSCGLPVVSFDCENGPRSIVTNGIDGFLIHPFDVEEMANRLVLLMKDEKKRRQMASAAHQSSQRYAIEDIANQWKDLFERLVAEK